MHSITLLTIGTVKEQYLKDAVAEYVKRLSPYMRLEVVELKGRKFSEHTQIQAQLDETRALQTAVDKRPDSTVVLLEETGIPYTSKELALWLGAQQGKLLFVIAGPLGFAPGGFPASVQRLSLSPMTFTHDLARLLLLEQLYRAATLNAGKTYHY